MRICYLPIFLALATNLVLRQIGASPITDMAGMMNSVMGMMVPEQLNSILSENLERIFSGLPTKFLELSGTLTGLGRKRRSTHPWKMFNGMPSNLESSLPTLLRDDMDFDGTTLPGGISVLSLNGRFTRSTRLQKKNKGTYGISEVRGGGADGVAAVTDMSEGAATTAAEAGQGRNMGNTFRG